jgi:3-hydroxyisobutyrate dehydrogenase
MRVGFAGMGRMGRAIAPHLARAGHAVRVWNRTYRPMPELDALGIGRAADPAGLAAGADVVFTMLTDDRAVEEVYRGPGGLLSGARAGAVFVEMSTVRPDTVRAVAAAARERGADLVDAPMSGTLGPAREGRLLGLVGGSDEAVARVRPLLDAFCRRVEHLGPTGAGATMKIVLNMPMAVYWQALAEAVAIGAAAGLEERRMLELIADSPAAVGLLKAKIPAMLGEEGEVAFDVAGVRKDLIAMVATGQLHAVPTPAAAAALAGFSAAVYAGWGAKDLAALVPFTVEATRTHRPGG